MAFRVPNEFRIREGALRSADANGNNGAFLVKLRKGPVVFVVASDGAGWEHVSVSRRDRCPTWEEMCQVKDMFWDSEDCAVQFHPPRSEYVNNHPYCLHLWREIGAELQLPASILVGAKEAA